MSEVSLEYNPETGRMEGTYRVDCASCGVRYTGIYDMPHRCKEPLIFQSMPILRFEPFSVRSSDPPAIIEEVVSWKGSAEWQRVLTRAATSTRSDSAPGGRTSSGAPARTTGRRGGSR
jgi:hypothetical protein